MLCEKSVGCAVCTWHAVAGSQRAVAAIAATSFVRYFMERKIPNEIRIILTQKEWNIINDAHLEIQTNWKQQILPLRAFNFRS